MAHWWVLALAGMDCDGDGVPTATAGLDSPSHVVTCAQEMVGAIFGAVIPFFFTDWKPPLIVAVAIYGTLRVHRWRRRYL